MARFRVTAAGVAPVAGGRVGCWCFHLLASPESAERGRGEVGATEVQERVEGGCDEVNEEGDPEQNESEDNRGA
jgi:hypothetical protein